MESVFANIVPKYRTPEINDVVKVQFAIQRGQKWVRAWRNGVIIHFHENLEMYCIVFKECDNFNMQLNENNYGKLWALMQSGDFM